MKADTHPQYCKVQVNCTCGNSFETGSTECNDISVEVCSECHPFYTGQQKVVDSAGRVGKFQARYGRKA